MSLANLAGSLMSTVVRGTTGINSAPARIKPKLLLQLYDIENCPYCRLVREVFTELDLDVEIYPCPKLGELYRSELTQRGGKAQFPYLVDRNTGVEMYESLDIVAYLYKTYAERSLPLKWRLGTLQTAGSMLASATRMSQGMRAKTGAQPEQLLELYSFESSPYARLVRECLCELEIAYIVRNCGRSELREWVLPPLREALNIVPDSQLKNRQQLQAQKGKVSIPYLFDVNTGFGLFESADIVDYISDTYSL
jgi:glutathione S-transferase